MSAIYTYMRAYVRMSKLTIVTALVEIINNTQPDSLFHNLKSVRLSVCLLNADFVCSSLEGRGGSIGTSVCARAMLTWRTLGRRRGARMSQSQPDAEMMMMIMLAVAGADYTYKCLVYWRSCHMENGNWKIGEEVLFCIFGEGAALVQGRHSSK